VWGSSSVKNQHLGVWILTALVVGNMVGSGIFMLPRSLAEIASPGGTLLAWAMTGAGVLMLALVFGNLAIRKPELAGGIQLYAKSLFREGTETSRFAGYTVAWGYWVANWTGNVAIITTFASYLSTFFPSMSSGNELFSVGSTTVTVGNMLTFIVCTILLWGMHTIILRGIQGAGRLNFMATAAKVMGFLFFIVISLFMFEKSNIMPFADPVLVEGKSIGLLGQINGAAVATLWAFVGVESAVVFSSRAKKPVHIKIATILGLTIALFIYMGISALVMGTLPHGQLVTSDKPLVDALSHVIGSSGSYVMAGLGLISLTGSTIGWILLSSEVAYQAARQDLFIPAFKKENKHGAPVVSLIITNICAQLFIFSTISGPISKAFSFITTVATLSYLVPYILASIFQLKLVLSGETYKGQGKTRLMDGIIGVLAALYSVYIIKMGASDPKTFLLGVGLFLTGILFWPLVRKKASSSKQQH
jgi:arginine:ornithine antiporter / lysine permease